ncbi:MAG: SMP-30/gluconolactonase/LRE family protein [Verrucomicrobia bacterium]|nr:SMP-30/gluconolactonase/LRE family protein [Verrucomicrobiota bacterium]
MKYLLLILSLFLLLLSGCADRVSLSDLVAPGAEVEVIAEGFVFTEGPVWDKSGTLLFSDVRVNKIMQLGPDGNVSVFIDDIGTNGLYFDNKGFLIVCGNLRDRVMYRILGDGSRKILADRIDGKRLNSPNDCWVDPEGGIYFSDPRYRDREVMEMEEESLYFLSPHGELSRIDNEYTRPNGLIGTPDGKILYVADYGASVINRYEIESPGVLKNKTRFADSLCDGMTLDEYGNLYVTKEVVAVYRPDGTLLGEIKLPGEGGSTNVTFGGTDRKTLFITGGTRLMKLDMQVAGVAR